MPVVCEKTQSPKDYNVKTAKHVRKRTRTQLAEFGIMAAQVWGGRGWDAGSLDVYDCRAWLEGGQVGV